MSVKFVAYTDEKTFMDAWRLKLIMIKSVWMLKFSSPNGPRIDPRTGWTRAKFVCVGDVEPKTLLQVW